MTKSAKKGSSNGDAGPLRPSLHLAAGLAASLGGRRGGDELLHMCYTHVREMLQEDRGLRVVSACDDRDALCSRIDRGEAVLVAEGEDETVVHVFFDAADERTGIKLLRSLRDAHGADARLLIVSLGGPTPFVKKEAAAAAGGPTEFWVARQLLSNPTRHRLVPTHTRLTTAEADSLAKQRILQPHMWPTISASDIVVRWHGFPTGSILRIDRSGLSHEAGAYYRRVVAAA